MATVTASAAIDNTYIDISDWINPAVTPGFFDNVNFASPVSGTVYQDYAQSLFTADNARTVWAGTGMAYNSSNHTLTAGTVSGIFGQSLIGGNWVTEFSIENFSVAATLLSAALNSASLADDQALFESIFSGADTFNLSADADTVSGYAGNDTLNGFAGNDFLEGGAGNDSLNGGIGNDWAVYTHSASAVKVLLGTSAAQNTVGAGTDTLVSIEGVIGSNFADTLNGASGNGIFELFSGGKGNDTINGGVVSDTVNYTDGNQVEYWPGATGGANVNLKTGIASDGQGGTDTLVNIDFVIGTSFADTIVGSDSALFEAFTGMAGNDSFNGGDLSQGSARINYNISPAAVNVDLAGGFAQDGYGTTDNFVNINFVRGSNFGDTLRGSNATDYNESFEGRGGNDLIDGRGGIDQARYDSAPSAVNVSLVTGLSSGGDGVDTLIGIENLRGSAFDDTLTGNAGTNTLDGRAGNDSMAGGAGDDTFVGGAGNDTFDGGTQESLDFANYGGSGGAVTVNLANGTAVGATEGTDTLIGIEAVFGSAFAERLTGDAETNFLRGNGGNDTLDGAGGTDIADYGAAATAVTVDLQAATATGGDGSDQLISIEYAYGSIFNDTLFGDAGENSLRGRAGNDTLDGRGGLDRADYRSATGAVTVSLATNTSSGADGVDTLINIENLRGSEAYGDLLTGSGGANVIDGMGGNDTLSGGAGNDSLIGGLGNDSLAGGSGTDTLVGGDGNDVYTVDGGETIDEAGVVGSTADLVKSTVTWTLGANLERLALGGTTAINGTGNALANVITGNSAANVLSGSTGNDTLSGAAGNDTLSGGTGNDSMAGGDGNDVYVVDSASDIVTEAGTVGSTADRVQSSVTWTLGTNVERLTLSGTANINGTGNTLANVIVGNTGNNVLSGGSSNDTLSGGAGNDLLIGGSGGDSLTGGTGLDAFRFNAVLSATTNVDRIADFVAADDTIQLDDAVFAAAGPVGALAAGAFKVGLAAGDASDRVIYDSVSGNLYYDADGTGAAAKVLFATLTTHPTLTAADFVIV